MSLPTHRSLAARGVPLIASVLLFAIGGVVLAVSSPGSSSVNGKTEGEEGPPPLPDPDLVDALLRAGLDAESLTASGVTTDAAVDALVLRVESHLVTALPALQAADADYATQKVLVDTLRRKVRSGQATSGEIQQLATAKTALETATTDRDNAVQEIFDAACSELPANTVTTLETLRANRSWKLPVEFLTLNQTQQAWVDLRAALADERISANYDGEEIDPASATLLSDCRAEACVSSAKTALDTHLGHVQAQWGQSCAAD